MVGDFITTGFAEALLTFHLLHYIQSKNPKVSLCFVPVLSPPPHIFADGSVATVLSDMENEPDKPGTARVFSFGTG